MSENLRRYTKALYAMDAVVRRVPEGAWDQQSPCTEWTARQVVGHVTHGSRTLLAGITGGTPPPEDQDLAQVAGADPCATIGECMDYCLAALDQPGVLAKTIQSPMGEMTVDQFLGVMTADAFTHTWDVACAAGIDHGMDDGMATTILGHLTPMDAMLRGSGMFEPAIEVPADADPVTKLMGFLGRSE